MSLFFDYADDFLTSSDAVDEWKVASSARLNDNLYIVHASERLTKYDGATIYWAGLPKPSGQSVATNATGSLSGDYKYIFTFIQVDARGNTWESEPSDETSTVSPSSESIDITLPDNFDFASRADDIDHNKFNIKRAYANGNQSGVTTINVNFQDPGAGSPFGDDEKLSVGSTAYFLDRSSGDYVARKVTAVGASSITIEGAAVNVNDTDPISANLKLAIYRTVNAGTDFYLVAEVPWNIDFNGVYNDNTADGSLGAQFIYPLDGTEHGVPPKAGYSNTANNHCWTCIGTYKNRLILGGAKSLPNTIVYSIANNAEYFPTANSFIVGSQDTSRITGIVGTDRFFVVFKEDSCYRITGSLESNDITVETLSGSVGCVAHESIQKISYQNRSRIVFLAKDGVYEIIDGSSPIEVSTEIRSEFDESQFFIYPATEPEDKRLALHRATSLVDLYDRKYCLYLPVEDKAVSPPSATRPHSDSRVLVYDYGLADRGEVPQWYKWNNINMASGGLSFDGAPAWLSFNDYNDVVLHRQTNRNDKWTAYDHLAAIDSFVEFGSLFGPSPDILSKYIRVKICSLSHKVINEFTLSVKTLLDYEWFNNTTNYNQFTVTFGGTNPEPRQIINLQEMLAFGLRYKIEHAIAEEKPVVTALVTEIVAPNAERMKLPRRPHYSV